MLRRKKIDYKIKKNDTSYFVKLGNIFPTHFEIQFFYEYFPTRLQSLLDRITGADTVPTAQEAKIIRDNFMYSYVAKSREKTLSNYYCSIIDFNGLDTRFDTSNNDNYYVPKSLTTKIVGEEIYTRFSNKWLRLYNTLNEQYDAIRPYVMSVTEEMEHQEKGRTTDTKSGDITDSGTVAKTGGDTITENSTKQHTGNDITYKSHTGTNTKNIEYKGSDSKVIDNDKTTSSTNTTENDTTVNQIKGFNSVNFNDSDKSINNSKVTETGEDYEDVTETVNFNSSDKHTDNIDESEQYQYDYNNTHSDNNEKEISYDTLDTAQNTKTLNTTDTIIHGKGFDNTREITRLGNIGNTSQQELIMKEFELRKIQIIDIIYKDLDSVLTRSKYI